MGIALSETYTKYHGKREKVARVTVPGVTDVTLTLSDTLRCAKLRDSARRTVENISRGELGGEELEAAAEKSPRSCGGSRWTSGSRRRRLTTAISARWWRMRCRSS